jgi:hypothetical protein
LAQVRFLARLLLWEWWLLNKEAKVKQLSKTMMVIWVVSYLAAAPLVGQDQQGIDLTCDDSGVFKGAQGLFNMNLLAAEKMLCSFAAYQYLQQVEKECHFSTWYQESKERDQKESASHSIKSRKHKPPVSVGRFFAEFSAGVGGGLGMIIMASAIYESDGWFPSTEGVLLILSAQVLGSALGVYLAGNLGKQRGSFGSALAGSLLGEAVSVVILVLTKGEGSGILYIGAPLGATLMFNSRRRYKAAPVTQGALLNIKRGKMSLDLPVVQVLQEDPLTRSMGFCLRLMNLEW